jgi:hypothetical protein
MTKMLAAGNAEEGGGGGEIKLQKKNRKRKTIPVVRHLKVL